MMIDKNTQTCLAKIPTPTSTLSIDEQCRHFIPTRLARDGWWLEEPQAKPDRVAQMLKLVPAMGFPALVFALLIVIIGVGWYS